MYLYLCIYSFSICSYVFCSHPERCLLTRFRVSFLQFLPLLRVCVFGMFPCLCLLPGARGTHRTHALHLETRFRVPLPLAPSHLVIRFRMQPSPFPPSIFFFFLIRFVTFYLNCVCIISWCFRSHFNFFSTHPARRHPVLTSSGRIHPLAVGDHVYLVEDIQYRITKLSPDSDSVCLQKINSRDRPFKRSIRQI